MRTRSVLFALALALGGSACMVRGSGYVSAQSSGTAHVVYSEPPAARVEAVSPRPGFVWVRGRWDWRGGQWTWIDGHWERERAGYVWSEGRWERRGSSWHWIEGRWSSGGAVHTGGPQYDTSDAPGGTVVTGGAQPHGHGHGHGGGTVVVQGSVDTSHASGGTVVTGGANPMYPTQAPPPPRTESYGAARAGFVWVTGRWDWRNGQWMWVDGHWERERANQVWIPGRWELQGNYYVWIEGRWGSRPARPSGPVIRDHR